MKHYALFEHFGSLNREDQESVIHQLLDQMNEDPGSLLNTRESELTKTGISCPHCSSKQIVGFGSYGEGKRYKCKECSKTFNSLSGSVAHGLHKKHLLKQYLYLMLQGYSLRKITMEIDICLKTAFDWRHKVLRSLSTKRINMNGVIEADETFFLYSEKGKRNKSKRPRKRGGKSATKGITSDQVAVLTAYERKSGDCINTVVCKGRITKSAIEKGLGVWMDKKDSILCTDSHKSFEGFALDNQIAHKRTFARRNEHVIEKVYHIQHVNNIHGDLKKWIVQFNGVSSKYLQHYLNYFNLVRKLSSSINQSEKALKHVLQQKMVYLKRNQISQQYCIT